MNDLNDILSEVYAATHSQWKFSHWERAVGPGGLIWAAVDTEGHQRMFCGSDMKEYLCRNAHRWGGMGDVVSPPKR